MSISDELWSQTSSDDHPPQVVLVAKPLESKSCHIESVLKDTIPNGVIHTLPQVAIH